MDLKENFETFELILSVLQEEMDAEWDREKYLSYSSDELEDERLLKSKKFRNFKREIQKNYLRRVFNNLSKQGE